MAAQPLTVTPELLQRAWRRRPRSWPDTLEACQAHPIYSRLLRAAAVGLAEADRRRAQWEAAQATRPQLPAAAPPTRTAPPARPAQAALFDPKRLAAGDTDDD